MMDTKNWKWFKYEQIFEISTFRIGSNVLNSEKGNIPYIGASCQNNGITNYVDFDCPLKPNKITVARNGSVCSAFYQTFDFVVSPDDIRIFELKGRILNEYIAIFLCHLIEKERYRYAYGRKFGTGRMNNQTIKLPIDYQGNPDWYWIENYVKEILIPKLPPKTKSIWQKQFAKTPLYGKKLELNTNEWHWFTYSDVFEICKGFYNKKPDENANGEIPFIGATDSNNGITSFHDLETIEVSSKTGEPPNAPLSEKIFDSNCITVSNNGSVGYAFYQPKQFTCTHDVNPLYLNPKWGKTLNKHIALFLCTIIEMEQFRWAYGRKWRPKRMPSSLIKLPATKNANGEYEPDWDWMENYIKALPYSGCL